MPPFPSSAASTVPPATTRPTVPGPSLVPPPRPEPVRAERFHFLGTFVDGFTIASFIERLAHAVARDESLLVTNHNINSLTVLQHDPKFADLYDRAGAVFVDGQPVVALGRLFGAPVKAEHRVAVLDWIWPLFDRAEREGWRIVHLGGSRAVLEEVRAKVVRQHPRLSLTLVDGFFDPSDPESLQQAMGEGMFDLQATPAQEAALARLETALALVEGWVDDVVTEATARWMPAAVPLAETVRRRRATGGPAEATFATLVGLELRPRRLRDAANLWAAVRDARGAEGRDAVWSHPDLVPTSADLDDPLGFARTDAAAPTAGDEDFDAALAELLDEAERPQDDPDAQDGDGSGTSR